MFYDFIIVVIAGNSQGKIALSYCIMNSYSQYFLGMLDFNWTRVPLWSLEEDMFKMTYNQ